MQPDALMLIALIGAHCFLDYAGQGDFMARAKDVSNPLPGVPAQLILWQHAAIHGAAVALVTGVWWLFLAETLIHALTDAWKCARKFGFVTDQVIHLACKAAWFAVACWAGP